eukprot:1207191-Rhodomonas_salina.2
MDVLRERLIFLTDNNLVYNGIMGKEFLTQPREITMAWLWIPASYCTGHPETFKRITAEMLLAAGTLIFTLVDNNSFKEGNDTGLEPEVLGTLLLLWGCAIVLPAVYVCFKGSILDSMDPIEPPPKFEKFKSFFLFFGLLKEGAKALKDGNLDVGELTEKYGNQAKEKAKEFTNINSMEDAAVKAKEVYTTGQSTYEAARRASQGRVGGESYEETQQRITGANFGSPEEEITQANTVTGHIVVAAANMGHPAALGVGPGMGESKADLARHAAHLDGVHGLATEHDVQRIHHMDHDGGVEAVNAGSSPTGWKQLVMPLVGMLAALVSGIFYQGAWSGYWTWEREGKDPVDLNDRFEQGGKILMVQAWMILSQLAAAAFKDVDLEFRMKELMLEFNTAHVTKEQYDKATSEPTGTMEGFKNALMSPFRHCKVCFSLSVSLSPPNPSAPLFSASRSICSLSHCTPLFLPGLFCFFLSSFPIPCPPPLLPTPPFPVLLPQQNSHQQQPMLLCSMLCHAMLSAWHDREDPHHALSPKSA